MRFASLGSGSKGNSTLVAVGDTLVMIDCGFTRTEAETRLRRLGVSPGDIDAILVTHEHADHASGVPVLSRAHGIPVYASHGTALSGRLKGCHQLLKIDADQGFDIGELSIQAIAVPHDAREPVQFTLVAGEQRLGVLTDLGSVTPHVLRGFGGCTALLVEANHDLDMLRLGAYPPKLKQRVGSDYGHLNNAQTAAFIESLDTSQLAVLVVGHMSEQNNRRELVAATLASATAALDAEVVYACQAQGFDWLDVTGSTVPAAPDAAAS